MSKGKYSPSITIAMANRPYEVYCYNADKQIPPEYVPGRDTYNERLHFADYDADGFDRYGYSALDADGNYVGIGEGIDRFGYTEMDYLRMSDDDFEAISCGYY